LSEAKRSELRQRQQLLGLGGEDVASIENLVTASIKEHLQKLQQYEQVFLDSIKFESPVSDATRKELQRLQQLLDLSDETVTTIESRLLDAKQADGKSEYACQEKEDSQIKEQKALVEHEHQQTKQKRQDQVQSAQLQQARKSKPHEKLQTEPIIFIDYSPSSEKKELVVLRRKVFKWFYFCTGGLILILMYVKFFVEKSPESVQPVPITGVAPQEVETNFPLPTDTKFPLPTSLPAGTSINVGGSQSLEALNKSLQDAFKKKFTDSEIVPTYTSSSRGLEALSKGEADIIGVGRQLTKDELAKGFDIKVLGYEKIAIIISDKNTFLPEGNIDFDQFAKIYKGEIQDWSKVGGNKGAIKVIDHSDISDTRQAFASYPVFKSGLKTGNNAVKLTDNSAKAVSEKLGFNGIGYLPFSQIKGLPGIKVLSIGTVQPDNVRYPFSQQMSYVYPKDKLSEGAKALLGFINAPEGISAISATPGILAAR
jgi:ABC-type phosphate transport system substrate-binding protein